MKTILPLFLIATLAFSSCSESTLPKGELLTGFVNYIPSEVDTIIVKRYQKNSNFATSIDSALLVAGLSTRIIHGDTTLISYHDVLFRIRDDYDYEIINPFDQHSMRISDVQYKYVTWKRGLFGQKEDNAYSPVANYLRDGVRVTVPSPNVTSPACAYISK